MVYYNEIDPYAAQWLRNLIAAGHIANGEVDERSIQLVDSADLAGFTQCHFFAGVGVWSYALRLAGWSDDRPVWTGSCPCQPFSAAGKGAGFADERHLWPEFFRLINERRPLVVFGEQVASKDGLEWLDLVQADLERSGYASAAADLCAAGVGAPHIRQRLYWVADAQRRGRESGTIPSGRSAAIVASKDSELGGLDNNNNNTGLEGHGADQAESGWIGETGPVTKTSESGGLADNASERLEEQVVQRGHGADKLQEELLPNAGAVPGNGQSAARPTHGYWRDADWLYCRDGKWRPVEPSTFPLAHGAASRVGRLRAYGNAIVPQVAQTFIEAFMECRP